MHTGFCEQEMTLSREMFANLVISADHQQGHFLNCTLNHLPMSAPNRLTPPVAEKKPHVHITHGDHRDDPYYWLRERENQQVIDWLNAENAYTEAVLAPIAGLRKELLEEMTGRIRQDDSTVPFADNGYLYRQFYLTGKEFPILARQKIEDDEKGEEVLLDVSSRAEPHPFYQLGGWSISPSNTHMVWGEDVVGRRRFDLKFIDLQTGEILPDTIPDTTGSAVWAADGSSVFYTYRDPETLRACKIFRHIMGTDPATDIEVYVEHDETYYTTITLTSSRRYLVICSESTLASECRVLEAANPEGTFRIFEPRDYPGKHEYEIDHIGDHWYIRTNWQAENFRLMRTGLQSTGRDSWTEVVGHRPEVLLEGIVLLDKALVLHERSEGISDLRVRTWDGAEDYRIEFPEEVHLAWPGTNREQSSGFLRIGYQSLTSPVSVFDWHLDHKRLELRKEQEVLGGFRKEDYDSRRVYAVAQDGERVPVSVVWRPDQVRIDGTAPLLLYGYGSYGLSMDPWFSSTRLSLLDRGFVFAIAHIRGGQELGRRWYESGKLKSKMNTFTDFIACATTLLELGYGNPERLFAFGGSAGGLLMGAVMNLRPDLWKGIVAAVPFVDVLTTMLDDTIPLTTFEYDEWGNPADPEYYTYMKSYSPYDNVRSEAYPNLLVTTGLHDSQVQYWEPAKWVARLRELKTDKNLLLLHTDMEAGHGGKSGRFEQLRETALIYAFLIGLARDMWKENSDIQGS